MWLGWGDKEKHFRCLWDTTSTEVRTTFFSLNVSPSQISVILTRIKPKSRDRVMQFINTFISVLWMKLYIFGWVKERHAHHHCEKFQKATQSSRAHNGPWHGCCAQALWCLYALVFTRPHETQQSLSLLLSCVWLMSAPTCLLDPIAVRPQLSTEVSKPSPTIPRTSTIDVRHKVSLKTPSFSTQTVTFSPRFHRPLKCCFHHHRPSTPVARWVFTFSTQAVDFYPGLPSYCYGVILMFLVFNFYSTPFINHTLKFI